METRRSKLEIYLEVLKIVKGGTEKPTRIMYQANISWQPLMKILSSMVSQELIEEIDMTSGRRRRDKRTSRIYVITMKGEQVIRYFKGVKDFELRDVNIPL
jgi:predicted transcriptional regulator